MTQQTPLQTRLKIKLIKSQNVKLKRKKAGKAFDAEIQKDKEPDSDDPSTILAKRVESYAMPKEKGSESKR